MLVDKERTNLNQFLLESHHVVERLFVNDVLSELIKNFDYLFWFVYQDLVALYDQAFHLLSRMKGLCFPINLSRHGLV